MITIKTESEIDALRESCAIVRDTLAYVGGLVKPGVTTKELDKAAEEFIRMRGAYPSCLGYCGYPGSICASVNEEVVHGIPGERVLREGRHHQRRPVRVQERFSRRRRPHLCGRAHRRREAEADPRH